MFAALRADHSCWEKSVKIFENKAMYLYVLEAFGERNKLGLETSWTIKFVYSCSIIDGPDRAP